MKNKLLIILLVSAMSLTFLAFSIEGNSYNKNYFQKSFKENNIEEATGRSMDELMLIVDDIILYLKHKGEEELLEPYFNEREILHMIDVQDLFDLKRTVRNISIMVSVILLVYFIRKEETRFMLEGIIKGFYINYLILFGFLILISTNFTKYFTIFHEIFFDNDLWILNPKTDLMIQMLPEPFFIGIAIRIFLSFVVVMAITQIISKILLRKIDKENLI